MLSSSVKSYLVGVESMHPAVKHAHEWEPPISITASSSDMPVAYSSSTTAATVTDGQQWWAVQYADEVCGICMNAACIDCWQFVSEWQSPSNQYSSPADLADDRCAAYACLKAAQQDASCGGTVIDRMYF